MAAEHPDVTAGSTNTHQNWEVVGPEKWVPDGYACVWVDSRGAGRSPGFLDLWSAREARDALIQFLRGWIATARLFQEEPQRAAEIMAEVLNPPLVI
jgi:predicted acyl esterase